MITKALWAVGPHSSTVLAIAGFAFTGKTFLARELASGWPEHGGLHLPTESVILQRAERVRREMDGCSATAHDLDALDQIVEKLLAGEPVQLARYSWLAGQASLHDTIQLPSGGLLVIDGSVSCEPRLALRCQILLFVLPTSSRWRDMAIARDIRERNWTPEDAARQNTLKIHTVRRQFAASARSVDHFLSATWNGRGFDHEIVSRDVAGELVERL